jgi:hypothetical protein
MRWIARLHHCMYPNLVRKDIQEEMRSIAAGEQKLDPLSGKVARDKAYGEESRVKSVPVQRR